MRIATEKPNILPVVRIDYSRKPMLPFPEAKVASPPPLFARAAVRKNEHGLFVRGRMAKLFVTSAQAIRLVPGVDVKTALERLLVLGAVDLDFFLSNQRYIPPGWAKGPDGLPQYIYFWDTLFTHKNGKEVVRCMHYKDRSWQSNRSFVQQDEWGVRGPAVVLDEHITYPEEANA